MSDNLLGRVKWFNNKAGFGFVTVLDGERKGDDIFVHHSGINVQKEQYKYLVQGEYVSFTMRESDNEDHPFQAGDVTGVMGGLLMCETRFENKRETTDESEHSRDRAPRRRGGGPRSSNKRSSRPQEGDVFVLQRQVRE